MLTRLALESSLASSPYEDDLWVTNVENWVDPPIPRRKLRILALHGFGQSGDYLRIAMKTEHLTNSINKLMDDDQQYDGVEWLCPDAPLRLLPDSRYNDDDEARDEVDIFAWWRILDFNLQHEHLYRSLEYLSDYLREHGPVDGIVGFSQGAAVAMMLAALCEDTPQRRAALATQGAPFSVSPPQAPFKFAIACCGFKNAVRYYDGFYSPAITTPSLHVVAEFDTMVSAEQSESLANTCKDARTIHFRGTHHVPTDKAILREMASFIADRCVDRLVPFDRTYKLPGSFFDSLKQAMESNALQSPFSSLALSPCSSVSGESAKSRRTHLRIIRRPTLVRRASSGRF